MFSCRVAKGVVIIMEEFGVFHWVGVIGRLGGVGNEPVFVL
jgi:hypothetical protein